MHSFAIVIRRAYFGAEKRRKYAKNVVVNRSGALWVKKRNLLLFTSIIADPEVGGGGGGRGR